MSKDAAKIRAKYPGHFPVICVSSDGTAKRKLLVPASMTSREFEAVAQDRCAWACAGSSVQIDGETLSNTCSVRDIYDKHKAADDFLYVTVTHGRSAASETAAVAWETAAEAEQAAAPEVPAKPDNQQAPCVFHMPDHDRESQSASAEAQRVRKVIKKYPDRVPVLVRQAATAGLPHIDRKLLVPKSMTASGLQGILPKHIAIAEDISIKWDLLRLFMGDEPIPDDAVMSDVYSQYVDEDDGGLHITLKIEVAKESQEDGEDEDAQAAYARQLKEALEWAQERADAAKQTAACAEEQAAAAEQKASLLMEQLEQSKHQVVHLGQAYISETEKTTRLQAALDWTEAKLAAEAERHSELQKTLQTELEVLKKELEAKDHEREAMQMRILEAQQCANTKGSDLEKALQDAKDMLKLETEKCNAIQKALHCCEEQAVRDAAQKSLEQKKLKEAERNLQILTEKLVAESAEKNEAREQTRQLKERLAALEEVEARRQEAQRVQAAREQELEAEGFVHLGWDRATGWATELEADEEFEVLIDDTPVTR
eukprot:TRINITY_DN26297_c0_g1_i1.p1 TRINITY_DN26297_c0_g1~~TRINITY_DN26297_c0_g1_i1.p1  ORF type:complete len:559 (-),score=189.67 TRINITY_DN26297_c0_g1_i1:190-1815(-)